MKISMYILEKWLEKEHPVSTIREGRCDISGLRLFEEGSTPLSDYLYVGDVAEHSSKEDPYNILLMHHNDIIRLKSDDLNYIVNRILEAFDYFDALENRFFRAYYQENPEQEIISAVEDMLGPCFIMKTDYRILACSKNLVPETVNGFWPSFSREGEPSLQAIERMKNSSVMQVFRRNPDMQVYEEPEAYPYQYGIANTYRYHDGSVIGHLVIADKEPISNYIKDMAGMIMAALNHLQMAASHSLAISDLKEDGEILLANLIRNPHDQRSRDILNVLNAFARKTTFRILCLKKDNSVPVNIFRNKLSSSFSKMLITTYEEYIVALVWKNQEADIYPFNTDENPFMNILQNLFHETSLSVGISNWFYSVEDSSYGFQQALFALNATAQECIRVFDRFAVQYLIGAHPLEQKKYARHPAIQKLEKWDAENETDLLLTLKLYLHYERSVKKTAENLYIHKNTVVYRIHQIQNLCCLNLEDDREREYLILSLILS